MACQTITISPVTDGGGSAPPPTPGPETPPVEPAPPETPPSGGGGGGSTSPPTTTTVVTTYTSQGDFNGTQGYRGWYYLEEDETPMTYSAGSFVWNGGETYQGIWATGQHPGSTHGAMRRWVAQGTGTFAITGQVFDADTSGSGNNVTLTINKNGVAIYGPQTIVSGDATGYALSGLTGNCTAADTFDFLVKGVGGVAYASTGLSVSIALTTTTTTGGGSTTQTALPFTLNGTAPEEGTYTLTANKPSNANGCTIAITGVNYAASYGRIYFNGSTNSMAIWPTAPGNAGISATVTITVPVAYMVNGSNTLRFTHDSGSGYTVTAIGTPAFTTPATPTPPATQTSLPFDLRGVILPEDAILTVSLSKPSNANGATMTVTGVNLTELQGSYYINGQLGSAVWVSTPANAGVSASVVRSPDVTLFQNGNNTIRFTHTEGAGYTVSSVQVSFSTPSPIDPNPPTGNNGAFTNEPGGMTVLVNHNFNTASGGVLFDAYNSVQIVSDSSSPLSPPNVGRSRLSAGNSSGGCQLEWIAQSPNYRSMFVGKWWRTNPGFVGRQVGNKMYFHGGPPGVGSGLFLFGASGSQGSSQKAVVWSFNSAKWDNTHLTGNLGFTPNMGSGLATVGQWTKLESYVRASSTYTSRDGIIKWWVNGVLAGNFTTVNYCPEGLGFWTWTETWDGTVNPVPTNDWEHYFDHLYISGGN